MKHRLKPLWLVLALALAMVGGVSAATVLKTNNNDNLNLGSSWVGGTPPGSGDIAQWSSVVTSANIVGLGADLSWSGLKTATPGGPVTLNVGNTLTLGVAGVDLSTATQDLTANCDLALSASQSWPVASGRNFTVGGGVSGTALLTLPGPGTVTFNGGSYSFGTAAAGNNALALNGGTLVMAGGNLNLAGNNGNDEAAHIQGSATFKQTGGVVNSSYYTRVGSTGRGTLVVSGGQFNNSGEILFAFGNSPQGILVVSNTGTLNTHFLRAGNNGPCSLNLDGGWLMTDLVYTPSGQGYFYFNGGTLLANAAPGNPWFAASVLAYVKNGGAIIDTAGQNVNVAANLQPYSSSTGGLTKTGAGTLTLAGTNTYNGPTTVSNGTLAISGRLTSLGAVMVASGATLGAGQLTVGSLTLSPKATLAIRLGAPGNPSNSTLNINGNLVLDGNLSVSDVGGMSTGAVYSVINYTGALTDHGLAAAPNSAWDVTVDTSLTNFVRLIATRKFPFLEITNGDFAVSTLTTNLGGFLRGATTGPVWYEVRDQTNRMWDFGATLGRTPWSITVRHLRTGTNTVTVFAQDGSGTIQSNGVKLTLTLGEVPDVRPRPVPAEIWWGGLSDNTQMTNFSQWPFVQRFQDGYFFHSAGWSPSASAQGPLMQQLAANLIQFNTKFWPELGGYCDSPSTTWYQVQTNGWGSWAAGGQANGIIWSEFTHDYHMENMELVCQVNPTWSANDQIAWWTGDLTVAGGTYPYSSGIWRDTFSSYHKMFPQIKVGHTSQPEYWPWDSYPAEVVNQLSFTVSNPTTSFSFNARDIIGSFINMASAIGYPYFALQSDSPWDYFGAWGDPAAAATMRQKIRVYEQYLQSRGARHTLICNVSNASTNNQGSASAADLYYENSSLSNLYLHQQEGGRANRYLFESWYWGVPYAVVPETQAGSYTHLALTAIKYLKGIQDTNGTLEQLALGLLSTGATNQLSLTNNGDIACLPAIVATETGSPLLIARYFDNAGRDITAAMLSAEGYSPTNLLQLGQSLTFKMVVSAWAGAAPTATRTFTFEAFWNPQDPTGVVRDRKTVSVSTAGLPVISNLILNGEFLANAAAFVTWPGYLGFGSNPASIPNWSKITGGGAGVNGTAVGFVPSSPFAPGSAGGRTYAFIQGGTNGLSQILPLRPNAAYRLVYDVAVRAGNMASYKVEVRDNTQTYFTTGTMPGNSVGFVRFTNTFTTPGTLDGSPAIKLWNLTPGDNTVDFANVSLVPLWTNTPPVANPLTLGAVSGWPATLQIVGGADGPTDADGDPLTVTAVGAPAHGIASTDGTNATYTATNNYAGTDSFNYTVSDTYGGAATNAVTVSVVANSASLNRMTVGWNSGNVVLTFLGIPWNRYALERTFSLVPPVWMPVVTNLASADGYLGFTNSSPPSTNSFWRIRQTP